MAVLCLKKKDHIIVVNMSVMLLIFAFITTIATAHSDSSQIELGDTDSNDDETFLDSFFDKDTSPFLEQYPSRFPWEMLDQQDPLKQSDDVMVQRPGPWPPMMSSFWYYFRSPSISNGQFLNGKAKLFNAKFVQKLNDAQPAPETNAPKTRSHFEEDTRHDDKKNDGVRLFDFEFDLDRHPIKHDKMASSNSMWTSENDRLLLPLMERIGRNRRIQNHVHETQTLEKPKENHKEVQQKLQQEAEVPESHQDSILEGKLHNSGKSHHVTPSVKNLVSGDRHTGKESVQNGAPLVVSETKPNNNSSVRQRKKSLNEKAIDKRIWVNFSAKKKLPTLHLETGNKVEGSNNENRIESKTKDKEKDRISVNMMSSSRNDNNNKLLSYMLHNMRSNKKNGNGKNKESNSISDKKSNIEENKEFNSFSEENSINGKNKKPNSYQYVFRKYPRVIQVKRSAPESKEDDKTKTVGKYSGTNSNVSREGFGSMENDRNPSHITIDNIKSITRKHVKKTNEMTISTTIKMMTGREGDKLGQGSEMNVFTLYKPATNESSNGHTRNGRKLHHHAVLGLVILGIVMCVVVSIICTVGFNKFSNPGLQRINSRTAIYMPHDYY